MMLKTGNRGLWLALGLLLFAAVMIVAVGCSSGEGNGSQTTLGVSTTLIGPATTDTTVETPATSETTVPEPTTGASSTTTSTTEETTTTTEAPVAAEDNPPGDIPDNQAFVAYKAPAGFTVKIPEGWARVENPSMTSFTDKLNTIVLAWSNAATAPTVDSVQSTDVPALQSSEKAFELVKVSAVKLPSGDAVLVTYRANSEPNPVTGKQYRLDVLRYSLFNQGLRLDITLSSPVGADNVDPWNTVSRSVKWS
jgi:hypothetical protein